MKKQTPQTPQSSVKIEGRYAYEGLERIFHEKSRLSILASLVNHPEGLVFNDLKALCSLSDGNLSRQLQALEEAELVEVWKGFRNKRPRTLVRLTASGRSRFLEYVSALEDVVADAMRGAAGTPAAAPPAQEDGLAPA